ncbi:MAG: PHP domain-containing protein [Myxococcota bacterium]
MIDLHSHTTASDGQYAPHELVALAAQAGVTVLAVTDHDTVAGLGACQSAAAARGLRLVNGIELSAFINDREVHILGHFIEPGDARLGGFSAFLRTEREKRMERMVEKVCSLGFPVTMEEVRTLAGDAHLGRPHLARVMVERGFCADTKEAFDRYLGDGRRAYVDRYRLSGQEAIALIRGAKGAATVAHPGTSKLERSELASLAAVGLAGLEVYHSDHSPSVRQKFLTLAQELDLVPTAGSDFHGEKVAPLRKLGSTSMPPENLEQLQARAS